MEQTQILNRKSRDRRQARVSREDALAIYQEAVRFYALAIAHDCSPETRRQAAREMESARVRVLG